MLHLPTRIPLPSAHASFVAVSDANMTTTRQSVVVLTAKTSTSVAAIVRSGCMLEMSSRPAPTIRQERSNSSQYGHLEAAPPRCRRAALHHAAQRAAVLIYSTSRTDQTKMSCIVGLVFILFFCSKMHCCRIQRNVLFPMLALKIRDPK